MLLVQEVGQKIAITANDGIEGPLRIDLLKTNKCVLNLHKEKFYGIQFKSSILCTKEKIKCVQVFAFERDSTYLKNKNECLMRFGLVDEDGEKVQSVKGLVEAIEDFELMTDLLLATCMIEMKDSSS